MLIRVSGYFLYVLHTLDNISERTVGIPLFCETIMVIDTILLINFSVVGEEVAHHYSYMDAIVGARCSFGHKQKAIWYVLNKLIFFAFLMLHHYLHFRSSLVHCQSVFDLAILVVTTTICGEKPVFQGTLNGITEAIFLYHVLLLDPPRRPLSPKPRRDSMYSQFSLADFCSSMSSSYVKILPE